ncbi:cytochrome P450 [Paraburkholderia aspalathi]|uniref:cytochrome P450 n=1 Tax=Paraburkholderia aspalathi TaxID=1324617 RepID=UPI0038BA7F2D
MLLNPLSRKVRMHQDVPVIPGAFPAIGHLPAIVFDLPKLLDYGSQRFGSHFWINLGSFDRALVCTQSDAFDLFKNKDATSAVWREYFPAFGTGMIGQDGEVHRSLRSHNNAPFLPPGLSAAKVGELFAGLIEQRINAWVGQRDLRIVQEVRELMLILLFRLMGIEEAEHREWEKNLREYAFTGGLAGIGFAGMRLQLAHRSRAWLDMKLRKLVGSVRSRPDASGVLASLVRSFDNGDGTLTENHLLDNLRLVVPASHDSTAATMVQVVLQLAQRPEVWDALCAEARAAGEVPRNFNELARFPYAEAVFRETLRCHPVFPLSLRRTLTDTQLGGRTVEAGSVTVIPTILLSGHPDLFPQPETFLLDRWLGRTEGIKPIELLQFGAGPHRCPGYHLAWMTVVQFSVALALVMSAKRLRPRLTAPLGRGIYFPVTYPSFKTRVVFE